MRNYVDIVDVLQRSSTEYDVSKVPDSCPLKGFELTSSRVGVSRSDQRASYPEDGFDLWQVSIQYTVNVIL